MIKPLPEHYKEDEFDDLDEILTTENTRGSSKRKSGKVIPTTEMNEESFLKRKPSSKTTSSASKQSQSQNAFFICFSKHNWYHFLLGKRTRKLGMPFLVIAVFLELILESCFSQYHFGYNLYLLLTLEAAILFPSFPKASVRPQLCLSVLTLLSFLLDIYLLLYYNNSASFSATYSSSANPLSPPPLSILFIVLFSLFLFFKFLIFSNFLLHIQSASRIRKYLDRRLRLFFFPLKQPKRFMREIRGRFLAISWLSFFSTFCYLLFFCLFYFVYDFKSFYLSSSMISSLTLFLLLKIVTSFFVFSMLLYDIDIRLCLWYFGCFSFSISYIRSYIVTQRKKLGGFPLVFSYYSLRFSILWVLKIIDIGWGCYGWYLVVPNLFGKVYYSLDNDLKIFFSFLLTLLVISDLYMLCLFVIIQWLLRREKVLKKLQVIVGSDDSEIEDFHLNKVESEPEGDDEMNDDVEKGIRNPLLMKKKKKQKQLKEQLPVEIPTAAENEKESDFLKDLAFRDPEEVELPEYSSNQGNRKKNRKLHRTVISSDQSSSSSDSDNPGSRGFYNRTSRPKRKTKDGHLIVDEYGEYDVLDGKIQAKSKQKKRKSADVMSPVHNL
jgi:hypothetical protein